VEKTSMPQTDAARRFYAYLRDDGRESCHVVPDAGTFQDAALLYLERWAPAEPGGAELSVVVIDPSTGERRCFTFDLGTGEAEACA
jgi:hypothetical protein